MPISEPLGNPSAIERSKVIVAEGKDACLFLLWSFDAWGIDDIQLINFFGNHQLRKLLPSLKGPLPGSGSIQSLVVARDAEDNAAAAVDSATDALKAVGFDSPPGPFCLTEGRPRTAVIVFPGFQRDGTTLAPGTLEDLCLATVVSDPLMECVEEYIDCARQNGEPLRHERKTRLHAFLAAKADYAGLKLGEATKAGAWNLEHAALRPFKRIIRAI